MHFLKKHKKASIISIIAIVILVIIGMFLFIKSINSEQKSLDTLYYEQNRAFINTYQDPTENNISNSTNTTSSNLTSSNIYLPYSSGGKNILYADLYFYEENTGKVVTLEDVQEYLSQEYEEDGSIRIYNNGKHKEIQKYIEWYLNNDTIESQSLADLYTVYRESLKKLYPEENPELATNFLKLPFDEFVKVMEKYKDPSYVLEIPYDVAF